jgi:2-oxoglutarate dehydrogenase E2 component (dihydrolipoamide succinyltransferase)
MIIEIQVPSPGESINEVEIARWHVKDGDFVEKDQEIAEIESDKATLTIHAEESGRIGIMVQEGENIPVGAVLCTIDSSVQGEKKASKEVLPEKESAPHTQKTQEKEQSTAQEEEKIRISPLAKKVMQEKNIKAEELDTSSKTRITRKDVLQWNTGKDNEEKPAFSRNIRRERMSSLRRKLSERLVAVKNQSAMLTTFNEIDMYASMQIRKQYKDAFAEQYGVGLGFMSFFTKACALALDRFPAINSRIEGEEIIYHDYADIGIAVSTPKGLMVPVIRNAESLDFHEIEARISELAEKARNKKISVDELSGGTFSITNGGIFGSMLSTPIINPPQSAILGMHNIVERAVVSEGKIEIRPVMYVALSYDHRNIDGKESVGFLYMVKELIENPVQLLTGGKDPWKKLLKID